MLETLRVFGIIAPMGWIEKFRKISPGRELGLPGTSSTNDRENAPKSRWLRRTPTLSSEGEEMLLLVNEHIEEIVVNNGFREEFAPVFEALNEGRPIPIIALTAGARLNDRLFKVEMRAKSEASLRSKTFEVTELGLPPVVYSYSQEGISSLPDVRYLGYNFNRVQNPKNREPLSIQEAQALAADLLDAEFDQELTQQLWENLPTYGADLNYNKSWTQ